jgi:hypothetical protein
MAIKQRFYKGSRPTSALTKADLIEAAKMRDDGATWNQIRERFDVSTASGQFQKLWERHEIPHLPSRDLGTAKRLVALEAKRQGWYEAVARAQRDVEDAERRRDELVRQALEHGLGVRSAARALGIDKATVSRRYSAWEVR